MREARPGDGSHGVGRRTNGFACWPIARKVGAAWGAIALVALAGCGVFGTLDREPAHGADLSGNWLLDRGASEDPKPLLEKLRRQHGNPNAYGSPTDLPDDPAQSGPAGPPSGQGPRGQRGQAYAPLGQYRSDAFERSSVLNALNADLARDEQIVIRQSPDDFVIDYGSQVRSFTPGGKSVVSASWGVADQSAGWHGGQFVVQIRPQRGVATTERYSLSNDGHSLVEELHMGGGDFPTIELKRVYVRTDRSLSRELPRND